MKTYFKTVLLIAFTSISAQSMKIHAQPEDVVLQLFRTTDQKDWSSIEDCFAPYVQLDYSSMGSPAASLKPNEITAAWKTILPGFTYTHHQIGNLQASIQKNKASVFAYGTATHFLEDEGGNVWTVVGSYDFELAKQGANWKINAMTFHFKYQDGNTTLPQKAMNAVKEEVESPSSAEQNKNDITTSKKEKMKKVQFNSEGIQLIGNLYYPENYEENQQYPAIVVSGSWTTVKEQMAGLYAEKLAKAGFITLAFDFRNFGESEGGPRFYESPQLKKDDIKNAVTFLSQQKDVDSNRIGAFGVCAGAMYTLMAAAESENIKSVVTVASWLHDAEAVKLFYGGEAGVQAKIEAAQTAKTIYANTGEVQYVPTISETDTTAAMYGPYDYYLNPERGAIAEWSDDKFAMASWEDWLTANPMPYAKKLNKPILMVHSDGAVLPDYTKKFYNEIATDDKQLYWMDTELESPFHQFNYYDQEAEVNESVEQARIWFADKM